MKGYCVFAEFGFKTVIVTSIWLDTMKTIEPHMIQELDWNTKEVKKLILSKKKAEKIYNKIKNSSFDNLLEKVIIREVELVGKNEILII